MKPGEVQGSPQLVPGVLGFGWTCAFPFPAGFLRRWRGGVSPFYGDLAWIRNLPASRSDFPVFAGAVRSLTRFLCSHCSILLAFGSVLDFCSHLLCLCRGSCHHTCMRTGLLECQEDTWELNTLIRATEVKGAQECSATGTVSVPGCLGEANP